MRGPVIAVSSPAISASRPAIGICRVAIAVFSLAVAAVGCGSAVDPEATGDDRAASSAASPASSPSAAAPAESAEEVDRATPDASSRSSPLEALAALIGNGAAEWPSFRGPNAGGIAAAAANLPVDWDVSSGSNVRWSAPIPGYSHSSPIVWGDRVFVVTTVSDDPSADGRRDGVGNIGIDDLAPRDWRIYALSREDGAALWQRSAARGTPRVRRHEKGSHANSTPVTDGRYVVAVFNSEGMFCWTVDGEPVWSVDLGRLDPGYWGQPDRPWGHASSPIIFEDTVIVQSDDFGDSFLAAFRLDDGAEVWRTRRDELATWSTPVLVREGNRTVLVTQGGNHIRAYDPRSGAALWRFADHAEVKVPTPLVTESLVIVTGGAPRGRPIYAFEVGAPSTADAAGATPEAAAPAAGAATRDPASRAARPASAGRAMGSDSAPPLRWTVRRGGPYTSTPLAYRGMLYVTRDAGILNAYELATGDLVYQQRLGMGFSASGVAADGKLYLASEDGEVFVVRAGRDFELLATNDMGETIFATPAIRGDQLIVRTRGAVHGLGSE